MNKKVFTLLAASLMLFITAFTANAQTRSYGDTVKYLPDGMGQGAYHLKVTIGMNRTDSFLIMDQYGYVSMMDSLQIYGGTKPDSIYRRLRSSLWCVNIDKPETYGKVPGFGFTNKEYGAELAFGYDSVAFPDNGYQDIPVVINGVPQRIKGQTDLPLVGGNKNIWKFSRTYNTVPLETEQYLAIEVMPDYYMTFAVKEGTNALRLVVAHKDEFATTTDFYQKELVRFTLVTAIPRVLTAKDFNTMLYEYSGEASRTLSFSNNVSDGQMNAFAQPLMAENVPSTSGKSQYLYLKSAKGYVVVKDGNTDANYYNSLGYFYPKIVDNGAQVAGGQDEWRLVYYPSEDSLVINVCEIDHKVYGQRSDNGTYLSGEYDELYNQTIWNYLTLRMQDLSAEERVITVRNKPARVRAYFNINNCKIYDTDRTTVPEDLYTITDKDGRYLVVPLYAGDFTPQWMYLDENEVADMTPSCQWLVQQVNKGSEISKIHLVNREFNDIVIEYVQIYNTWHLFNGVWKRLDPTSPADYSPIVGRNYVKKESFHRVNKPYRNDPYLGYRFFSKKPGAAGIQEAKDSIEWFAFSFKYLTGLSDRHYMGFKDNASDKDTILYTLKDDKTYFRLVLPDTLRQAAYKMERYGIGWGDGYLADFSDKDKDDYIAPLERWFYHLKINDYWKFKRNNDYVVLDDNARYGYTTEVVANSRPLNKAKFYLRFTYRVGGVNYYTLLDRVDVGNFHHLTDITGLAITDTLRAYDGSHGSIMTNSYGVIQAAVHDRAPNYVRGQVKTLGSERVSTFAINCETEPLYRRFNTLDEGSKDTDDPDTVKFFRTAKPNEYIYEDAHSIFSYDIKKVPGKHYSSINFMGVQNEDDAIASQDKDQIYKRHLDTDWAIYVDTAYVNRGTGHIKPQYMLVVGPEFGYMGCPVCGEDSLDRPYVYGRYLRNETDSARVNPGLGSYSGIKDDDYIWDTKWDRLAFTPAIHAGDTLYILNGRPIEDFYVKAANGMTYVNYKKLNNDPRVVIRDLSNNLHKDEVFSFRFIEVGGGSKKDFLLETESENRNGAGSHMIAPMEGAWVKVQNGVPVVSRGSFQDWIAEAEVWNVQKTDKAPLANREVSPTDVVVAAGVGHVVVRNASGKQVTVSNILGQTIARVVLTSDDETIAAPQGVVVVAVEGENAVKAVVK